MKQHGNRLFGLRLRRLLSSLLCAAVLCGLLPVSLAGTARAAEVQLAWSDEDLETLRSYDIMRGDEGGMRPNDTIRRSEFAAMVNRALGYTERAGKNPFKDVTDKDWFFDDISISYNMGYLNGTSPTTVSPNGTLTREEALVILGRNLMLQPKAGESFSFADSRTFSSWSRGYLDPAVEAGIIDADSTGNFTPKKIITRGELAGMVVRAIGTPIQTPGVKNLDTVNGNVTITASGVTLRNTTINGDLYLTGGIGLGDVLLDNVTVNGRIVDSGAGLSEKGEISVALNNVTADELIVDSMRNQTISLSARGRTLIPKTSIRTPARVEDSTAADYGLRLIEIDGEDKTAVTLSGNIKEVHNKTPGSSLNIGEGVAEKVTVDEAAVDSTVTVGKDARIKYLNLDAGVKVSGSGSVDSLTVSANGATVTLPQAPDEIIIAPGITATINKQKMDTAAALEASSRPRLMPGYPEIQDLAPTSATALFKTNKPSTVYWAVTALADGSPNEEEIISPPSYAKKILKSSSVKVKESNKEYTAKISGLTSDGSYYLSTIVMDDKGSRSTMKVAAFTTPDNTTPAFSKGYPAEHEISEQNAQFAVMTTKSCNLYYALLPKGSTAPRAADFKAGSISGNLGYGVVKMEKNNPAYIFVNDVTLEEQKEYVLYLWLNDFDGAKSSAVKAMNFTTQDKTNPIISNLRQTDTKTTSSILSYSLSEQGTLYWAVVATGNETFMSPSSTTVTNVPFLETQEAKERVVSGVGALRKGSSPVTAAKAGADIGFTVSGLNSKTTGTSAYDLYYVARDKAGNWSDRVQKLTIYTLDTNAPKAQLKFTSYQGNDDTTKEPLGDTDIKIVFSKAVCVVDKDSAGNTQKYVFLDLYQQGKFTELADVLRKHVMLYKVPTSGSPVLALDEVKSPANYDIDYSKARVYMEGTEMVLEFPYDSNSANSAHHLANGGKYYFHLKGIQDTNTSPNRMNDNTKLDFKVKQAQIGIESATVTGGEIIYNNHPYPVDVAFKFNPRGTNSSPDGVCYDVMLWSDTSMTVNLFRRKSGGTWQMVGRGTPQEGAFQFIVPGGQKRYSTIAGVTKSGNKLTFYELKDANNGLKENTVYEYAVSIVTYGGTADRTKWNFTANLEVTVAAGIAADLEGVASINGTSKMWDDAIHATSGRVDSIGDPDPYTKKVTKTDSVAPVPAGNSPRFEMRDTSGTISMMLDRSGTIYWAVSKLEYTKGATPAADVITSDTNLDITFDGAATYNDMPSPPPSTPWNGPAQVSGGLVYLKNPIASEFIKGVTDETYTKVPKVMDYGSLDFEGSAVSIHRKDKPLELDADCWYGLYMVFEGTAVSKQVVCYRFKTHEAYAPILTLSNESNVVKFTVDECDAKVYSRLIPDSSLTNTIYNKKFSELTPGTDFDASMPSNLRDKTILDAMMSGNDSGDNSVFDKYASDSLKNEIARAIKLGASGEGANSVKSDVLDIDAGDTKPLTFNIPQDSRYFCVAVAENKSDASKRGFSAVSPVEKVELVAPTVTNAQAINLTIREVEDAANHKTYYVLTGTVSISYAGKLYVNEYEGSTITTRPFTQGGQDENTPAFFTDGRRWAGAKTINSINATDFFTVKPSAPGVPAASTQTLILSVLDTTSGNPALQALGAPAGYLLESKSWTEVTDETGNKTWKKPDFNVVCEGGILFPTEFVDGYGTQPTNTGNITYSNVQKNGIISQRVVVTYNDPNKKK